MIDLLGIWGATQAVKTKCQHLGKTYLHFPIVFCVPFESGGFRICGISVSFDRTVIAEQY
jgi:hypothetical protein